MSEKNNLPLITDALLMAIEHREPKAGLIHHTDQGTIYASGGYRSILKQHGMIASMSRKGDCHDNAVAESFFGNLKNELTWHRTFNTRNEARAESLITSRCSTTGSGCIKHLATSAQCGMKSNMLLSLNHLSVESGAAQVLNCSMLFQNLTPEGSIELDMTRRSEPP